MSVAYVYSSFSLLGYGIIVSYQHYCVAAGVKLVKERHYLRSCFGIEVAGGLVREEQRRMSRQRARHGHALLLTAGKLRRLMPASAPKLYSRQRFFHALLAFGSGQPLIYQRKLDVVLGGQFRQEIEVLKNKSYFFVSDFSQFILRVFSIG